MSTVREEARAILARLGVPETRLDAPSPSLPTRSPIDGSLLAQVAITGEMEGEAILAAAEAAFRRWRLVPPPCAANSCADSAKPCARPRPISAGS